MNKMVAGLAISVLLSCAGGNLSPSKSLPDLKVGEWWLDDFNQGSLQHAKVIDGKLFCNTHRITEGQNYLYCLSLETGKVVWRLPVNRPASQPIEIYNDEIYYATYIGEISKISMDGKKLWEQESPSSYAGHRVNPLNGNLIINTVVNGAYELNRTTGAVIHHYYFGGKPVICHLTLPLFYGDKIIFGNAEADSTTEQEYFVALDYKTKFLVWKSAIHNSANRHSESGPLILENYIVFIDEDNLLHCIDAINGERLWIKNVIDGGTSTKWIYRHMLDSNNLIYHHGHPVILDIKTGKELDVEAPNNRQFFIIKKENKQYQVIIENKVQEYGLEIEIRRE